MASRLTPLEQIEMGPPNTGPNDDQVPVATQEIAATQQAALNISGSALTEEEENDVICLLCPTGPLAFEAVQHTREFAPQHVFRGQGISRRQRQAVDSIPAEIDTGNGMIIVDPQATPEITNDQIPDAPGEFALRLSSTVHDMDLGFTFGRDARRCDMSLTARQLRDNRVSAMHFRIYINDSGMIMIEDTSTNGTIVDTLWLKSKNPIPIHINPVRQVLVNGSIVEVLVNDSKKTARFIVKIPERRDAKAWQARLEAYLKRVNEVRSRRLQQLRTLAAGPEEQTNGNAGADRKPKLEPLHNDTSNEIALLTAGTMPNNHGMRWNGGAKYKVMDRLGSGAFASVYRVYDNFNGKNLAIKEIEKKRVLKAGVLDLKMGQELQILKMMKHPHIIEFVDYEELERDLYIVMEYVPFGDLGHNISADRLSDKDHRSVVKQLTHALAYMHDKGVAHRDIKPENILKMGKSPIWVKIADFGLSKMIDQGGNMVYQTFCGTLLYCAPEIYPGFAAKRRGEVVNGRKARTDPYSVAVDIWSLAAVMFHLVCGRPAYSADGHTAATGGMLDAILKERFPEKKLQKSNVHSDWELFFQNTLTINPTARWSARKLLTLPMMRKTEDVTPIDYRYEHPDSHFAFGDESSDDEMEEESSVPEDSMEVEDDNGLDASQLSIREEPVDEDGDSSMLDDAEMADANAGLGIQGLASEDNSRYQLRPRGERTQQLPPPSPRKKRGPVKVEPLTPAIPQQNGMLFGEIAESGVFGSAATTPRILNAPQPPPPPMSTNGPAHEVAYRTMPHGIAPQVIDFAPGHVSPAKQRVTRRANGQGDDVRMTTPEMDISAAGIARASPSASRRTKHQLADEGTDVQASASFKRSRVMTPSRQRLTSKAADIAQHGHGTAQVQGASGTDTQDEEMADASNQETPRARKTGVRSLDISKAATSEAVGRNGYSYVPETAVAQTFPNKVPASPSSRFSRSSSRPPTPSMQEDPANPIVTSLGILTKGMRSAPTILTDSIYVTTAKTQWGRASECTHVYKYPADNRIPKSAFTIQLWDPAKGRRGGLDPNTDWTRANFYAVISTKSSRAIFINGVPLSRKLEDNPQPLGLLYTGDKITVWENGKEHMRFHVRFWFGAAKEERDERNDQFRVWMGEEDLTRAIAEAEAKRSDRTIKA